MFPSFDISVTEHEEVRYTTMDCVDVMSLVVLCVAMCAASANIKTTHKAAYVTGYLVRLWAKDAKMVAQKYISNWKKLSIHTGYIMYALCTLSLLVLGLLFYEPLFKSRVDSWTRYFKLKYYGKSKSNFRKVFLKTDGKDKFDKPIPKSICGRFDIETETGENVINFIHQKTGHEPGSVFVTYKPSVGAPRLLYEHTKISDLPADSHIYYNHRMLGAGTKLNRPKMIKKNIKLALKTRKFAETLEFEKESVLQQSNQCLEAAKEQAMAYYSEDLNPEERVEFWVREAQAEVDQEHARTQLILHKQNVDCGRLPNTRGLVEWQQDVFAARPLFNLLKSPLNTESMQRLKAASSPLRKMLPWQLESFSKVIEFTLSIPQLANDWIRTATTDESGNAVDCCVECETCDKVQAFGNGVQDVSGISCTCNFKDHFKHAMNGHKSSQSSGSSSSNANSKLDCPPHRSAFIKAACGAGKSIVGIGLCLFFPFSELNARMAVENGGPGIQYADRGLAVFSGPKQITSWLDQMGIVELSKGRLVREEGAGLQRRAACNFLGIPPALLKELIDHTYHLGKDRLKSGGSFVSPYEHQPYQDSWLVLSTHHIVAELLRQQRQNPGGV